MITPQSPKIDVWLENYGLASDVKLVAEALEKEGIRPTKQRPPDGAYALVIFGPATSWQQLKDQLAFWRKNDLMIIAVGMHHQSLEDYRIWELVEHGAAEVLFWSQVNQPEEIIAARLRRWRQVDRMLQSSRIREVLIGQSQAWSSLLRQVVEMACFGNAPILLMGESGTGKELIARLIHDIDRRPGKKDLVLVDCASVVPELSGSEFFGHEKGAFTNAMSSRDGAFALADEGSLFLDEIGELPLGLQSELLRVIQEGTFKRVGSNIWKFTDFRLISATNRVLPEEVKKGRFREDLFYRISTCVFWVPPLRERRSDIPALAEYFLRKALKVETPPAIDEPVMHYLINRDYPGNVRELRQLMIRIAYRHSGNGAITIGDIPEGDRPCSQVWRSGWEQADLERSLRLALANGLGMKDIKRLVSNKAMELAIEEAGGNLQAAAQRLQVTDRTLQAYQAIRRNGLPMADQ